MEVSTKVNGLSERDMAEVCKFGEMVQFMKVIGRMIWLMVEVG